MLTNLTAYGPIGIATAIALVILLRPIRFLVMALVAKVAFRMFGLSAAEQRKWVLKEIDRHPVHDLAARMAEHLDRGPQEQRPQEVARIHEAPEPGSPRDQRPAA